jgi:uncharacterized protein (DUF427 family)
MPRSSFSDIAIFVDDKAVSGIDSSTAKINVNDHSIAALVVPSSFNSELAGYVKIEFDALDQWLEEQSQIIFHPRDPYHRVDVLPTGRHIKIEKDGAVLADTGLEGGIMSLWETGLPPRWYLPRSAVCTTEYLPCKRLTPCKVNWEYLKDSPTHTGCPYKGEASYYHVMVNGKNHEDIAWWYRFPLPESALIQGMVCFYPDKVDMWVDGEKDKEADIFSRAKKEIEGSQQAEDSHSSRCNC